MKRPRFTNYTWFSPGERVLVLELPANEYTDREEEEEEEDTVSEFEQECDVELTLATGGSSTSF